MGRRESSGKGRKDDGKEREMRRKSKSKKFE